MVYIGASTHKIKTLCRSALPSTAHFPCSMSKTCVSTASKYSYFFSALNTQMPRVSLNQQQLFAQQSIAVPQAKISARLQRHQCIRSSWKRNLHFRGRNQMAGRKTIAVGNMCWACPRMTRQTGCMIIWLLQTNVQTLIQSPLEGLPFTSVSFEPGQCP